MTALSLVNPLVKDWDCCCIKMMSNWTLAPLYWFTSAVMAAARSSGTFIRAESTMMATFSGKLVLLGLAVQKSPTTPVREASLGT